MKLNRKILKLGAIALTTLPLSAAIVACGESNKTTALPAETQRGQEFRKAWEGFYQYFDRESISFRLLNNSDITVAAKALSNYLELSNTFGYKFNIYGNVSSIFYGIQSGIYNDPNDEYKTVSLFDKIADIETQIEVEQAAKLVWLFDKVLTFDSIITANSTPDFINFMIGKVGDTGAVVDRNITNIDEFFGARAAIITSNINVWYETELITAFNNFIA